jgi:hypothetical protein
MAPRHRRTRPRPDALAHMGLNIFAGDLFLRLARTGALVLEPGHADRLIADLTATLTVVRARREPEQALEELPKYIEAFQIAKRACPPHDHLPGR